MNVDVKARACTKATEKKKRRPDQTPCGHRLHFAWPQGEGAKRNTPRRGETPVHWLGSAEGGVVMLRLTSPPIRHRPLSAGGLVCRGSRQGATRPRLRRREPGPGADGDQKKHSAKSAFYIVNHTPLAFALDEAKPHA